MERKEELKQKLEKASSLYYNTSSKMISDKEFDKLLGEYISLGGKKEDIVGAFPEEGKGTINVSHKYGDLVGSLYKVHNIDELREWMYKITNELGYIPSFLITFKFDGNSIVIEYNNGKIVKVLTRGKNGKGLDLTKVFHHKIKYKGQVGIKYEVIITYEDFNTICKETNTSYVNPRSLVSGKLGDDDAAKYEKYFTLVPLWIKKGETEDTKRIEQIDFIEKEFGEDSLLFDYCTEYDKQDNWSIEEICDNIEVSYKEIHNKRPEMNYMIDGLVIEVMEPEARKKLGKTSKFPKWAMALKFPYMEEETEVTGFDFCLGDSGRITPRVWFKEVKFNGTKHYKQSLQNYKRFKELNLGIGSKILVQYHNDTLSYIEKLECEENNSIIPYEFTDKCPVCGGKIKINDNKTFAFCDNKKCKGKIIGSIQNFLVKMDIKGIKSSTLEKLKENKLILSIKDLYTMDYDKIANIEGLGETTAINIKKAITNKEALDYEVLGALGITNCSLETAKDVCLSMNLKELLLEKDLFNKLLQVNNVAEITAEYIVEGINDNRSLINFLLDNTKIKFFKDEIEKNKSNEKTLNIVFTGFRDKDFQKKLELAGHKISSSVSSKTDLLVTKDKTSSSNKITKARELGIKIVEPEEFYEMFNYIN